MMEEFGESEKEFEAQYLRNFPRFRTFFAIQVSDVAGRVIGQGTDPQWCIALLHWRVAQECRKLTLALMLVLYQSGDKVYLQNKGCLFT